MTRWYRAYEGTCTDPKLAEAAMEADCSRSVAIAAWHLILENAAAINDGGRINISPRRIAAALCEPLAVIEMIHSSFIAIGLLSGSHVAAWTRRQFESDNSTERSRRHRIGKKKMAETLPTATDATLQGRCATPPETETETELPLANANGRIAEFSASDMTKAIFDSGVRIIVGSGRSDREARSIIGRWRKQYSDAAVLTVVARCPNNVSDSVEWVTKALQSEAENGSNVRSRSNQGHRESTRAIGERLAARIAAGG